MIAATAPDTTVWLAAWSVRRSLTPPITQRLVVCGGYMTNQPPAIAPVLSAPILDAPNQGIP